MRRPRWARNLLNQLRRLTVGEIRAAIFSLRWIIERLEELLRDPVREGLLHEVPERGCEPFVDVSASTRVRVDPPPPPRR